LNRPASTPLVALATRRLAGGSFSKLPKQFLELLPDPRGYYSVPPEFYRHEVWVRYDSRLVRVFDHRFQLIATHVRVEPGRFSTRDAHIAAEKISRVEMI
jgi:hypothetical protein